MEELATKQDLMNLRGELKQDTVALRQDIVAVRDELKQDMEAMREQLTEELGKAIYDAETRLLNAFYGVANTHGTRLTEAEHESAALKERLAILEQRMTNLEQRLNFPPVQ
jgi:Rad3-related DNA helicase